MTDHPINLTSAIALALWREANDLEVGLRIPIAQPDLEKIKNVMYDARKGHMELSSLMLCVAPGGEEIWLVKRPQEAP